MTVKGRPHHSLEELKRKFSSVKTLEITEKALKSARAIGFAQQDIIDVVQALKISDFTKSETAHSPKNSRIWHDTYKTRFDGLGLYLKFAGETLVDLSLVSFKERWND